jgi:hypothetical protein
MYFVNVERREDYLPFYKQRFMDMAKLKDFSGPNRDALNRARQGMSYRPKKLNKELEDKVLNKINEELETNFDLFKITHTTYVPGYLNNNSSQIVAKDQYITALAPNYGTNQSITAPFYLHEEQNNELMEDIEDYENGPMDERAKIIFENILYDGYEFDEYDSEDSEYEDDEYEMEGGKVPDVVGKFGVRVKEPITLEDLTKKIRKRNDPFNYESEPNYLKRTEAMARILFKLLPENLALDIDQNKISMSEEVSKLIVRNPELHKLYRLKRMIDKQINKNQRKFNNAKVETERNVIKNLFRSMEMEGKTQDEIIQSYIKSKMNDKAANYSLSALRRVLRDNPDLANSEKTIAQLVNLDERRKKAKKDAKDKKLKMKIISENPLLITKIKNEIKKANPNIINVEIEDLLNIPLDVYESQADELEKNKERYSKELGTRTEEISKDLNNLSDYVYLVTKPKKQLTYEPEITQPGSSETSIISAPPLTETQLEDLPPTKDKKKIKLAILDEDIKTEDIIVDIENNPLLDELYIDNIYNNIKDSLYKIIDEDYTEFKLSMLNSFRVQPSKLYHTLKQKIDDEKDKHDSSMLKKLSDKNNENFKDILLIAQQELTNTYNNLTEEERNKEKNKRRAIITSNLDSKISPSEINFANSIRDFGQPLSKSIKKYLPTELESKYNEYSSWTKKASIKKALDEQVKNKTMELKNNLDDITDMLNNPDINKNKEYKKLLNQAKDYILNIKSENIIADDLFEIDKYNKAIKFFKDEGELYKGLKGETKTNNNKDRIERAANINKLRNNLLNIGDYDTIINEGLIRNIGDKIKVGDKEHSFKRIDPKEYNTINNNNIESMDNDKLKYMVNYTKMIIDNRDKFLTATKKIEEASKEDDRFLEKDAKQTELENLLYDSEITPFLEKLNSVNNDDEKNKIAKNLVDLKIITK